MKWRFNPGLSTRVAIAFGAISLVVALVLSGATYFFVRVYLVQQREAAALNRALIESRVVDASLKDTNDPSTALGTIPAATDSQVLIRVNGEWFSSGVTVSPLDLPPSLLEEAEQGGAWQRFSAEKSTFLAVAIPLEADTVFVEVFSFSELDQTLEVLGWVLALASAGAFLVGGAVGRYAGRRLLAPLVELKTGAQRITEGELATRVPIGSDPDLAAISQAFNEMASTLEERIERERRFSGNVSHELRSPLTGILGTAELLEKRSDQLPDREAALIEALSRQVRRFSATVLDLLEISRIGGDETVQNEVIDVSSLIDDVLSSRGLDTSLRQGEDVRLATDPRRFERIVSNLVENAQRHGEGLKAITVEQGPETFRLMVDDAGPGVPEDMARQIFEPFSRGDVTRPDGAGLGLAIVREQVRLLGGEVSVTESPYFGARFVVSLMRPADRDEV
ncbi:MAG: HAMP domain-containing protein [Actinobacteria bacterium]|nr:HAMP domain-containing protein [Actinomycetota bacterium]